MTPRKISRARYVLAGALITALLGAPFATTPVFAAKGAKQPSAAAKAKAGKRAAVRPKAAKAKQDVARTEPAAAPAPSSVSPPAPAKPLDTTAVDPREAAHMKKVDGLIAPARDYTVSAEDLARVREAVKAINGGKLDKARELAAQVTDPAGRKLLQWYRLRDGNGDPAEVAEFLAASPTWPDRTMLKRRMEETLFKRGGSPGTVKAILAKSPPETGAGKAALAAACLASGDEARARDIASRVWREESLPASIEPDFIARLGGMLTLADHKARLDRLLTDDPRWAAERGTRAAQAKRILPLLPPEEKATAEARLAEFLKTGSNESAAADKAANGHNWALIFQRAQQARRKKRLDEAAKLILSAPTDPAQIANLDGWWNERRALAYEFLAANKYKAAYDIVRDAGPLSVNPLKEQAFMAGWIALRELKDADAAERHFTAMSQAADGPLSRAKAQYWLGRTHEAKGAKETALKHYALAAREVDTFHGQLARQKLKPGGQPLDIAPPALPTPEQAATFNGLDAVKAAVIAHKAQLDKSLAQAFLYNLRAVLPSEAEAGMVAHLAEAMGDTQTAVRIAKTAIAKGQNLIYYSYPVHPFPSYTPLRAPPEKAFLLGVTRQETEFNTLTVSTAGAKGLLQVMAVTAKHVCGDYKIKCDLGRLLSDKPYNTMLASAYIADRMEEFSGSYVLGLAGYNAGPGRARQWMKAFGDPRDPKIDPIDWIEHIPFQETREYVTKVLSNIQVYRARLGHDKAPLRLEADLLRGRPKSKGAPEAQAAASVGE